MVEEQLRAANRFFFIIIILFFFFLKEEKTFVATVCVSPPIWLLALWPVAPFNSCPAPI